MKLDGNSNLGRYEWGAATLKELLPLAPSNLVLDIGAGEGKMKNMLHDCGARSVAFDLHPKLAEIMKWDLDDPPPNEWEKGGVALLLDVIEHCNNPGLALRHVSQILLPGAFLILTTPNPLWSRSRFEALAKGLPTCFKQSDLDLNHHVFTPWPHILQRLLSDSGFAIRHYFTLDGKTNWPRPRAQLKYPARLLFAMLNKLVESRDPSACGMSYGILAVQPR